MIYFIGGSPCSGKSTVAELICAKHGYCYYKLDDFLDDHMKRAAEAGKKHCAEYFTLDADGIWMRDAQTQCDEEFAIYGEIFDYAMSDIDALTAPVIIAEGAGFLPALMKKSGVSENRYVCIAPTPEFQLARYSEREWVKYVLADCRDSKAAFDNWMRRDMLFAKGVCESAAENGYKSIWVDGKTSPEEIAAELVRDIIS